MGRLPFIINRRTSGPAGSLLRCREEPTVENIRNGAYPFTIDVYAVTAGSANENTDALIAWILSEQGQEFIEICGYVGI